MIEINNNIEQRKTARKIWFKKLYSIVILLFIFFFTNSAFSQQQTFDYNGSNQTFTVPAGVTSVTVQAWGGGGAGGERNGNVTRRSGGGGGGGGYRTHTYTGLTLGNTFTITVGRGGIGTGGDGVNTTVTRTSQTNLVASAGSGGDNGTGGGGGSPGNGGNGGGTGSGPAGSSGTAGTDGVDGNSSGAGGNGGKGATANGGAGGTGAADGSNNDAGTAGVPGGGGGGANNDDNSDPSNGANGRVIFTWLCPAATISYTATDFCKSATSAAVTINGTSGGTFSGVPSSGLSINGSIGLINPSTSIIGTYTVHYQIAGGGGCAAVDATFSVKINSIPVSSVSNKTNITCFGAADGTVTVSAGGGTSPYTFSINNGANYFPATGTDLRQFTGLLPNTTYTIKVKDNNGCISN